MEIQYDDKLLVFGLDWHAQISNLNPQEFAKQSGAKWYWKNADSKNIGFLHDAAIDKKIKGIYSVSGMLASSNVESAVVFLKLNNGRVAVAGIFDGFISQVFDTIIELDEVEEFYEKAIQLAGSQNLIVISDVDIEDVEVQIASIDAVFEKSAKASLNKIKAAGKRSYLTYLILIVAAGGSVAGYFQYKAYRQEQLRIQMEKQQKTSQQMYDEEIARLKMQPALSVGELAPIVKEVTSYDSSVLGWRLSTVECPVTPVSEMVCAVSYERGSDYSSSYKDAEPVLIKLGFFELSYNVDLRRITGKAKLKSPQFKQMGIYIDNAKVLNRSKIELASQLQNVLKITSDINLKEFATIPLPAEVQEASLSNPPLKQAQWMVKAPVRSVPLITPIQNDSVITSVRFVIGKPDTNASIRSSFAVMEVSGLAFAK
ncbi:type 4b pilus protein PilO2 [Flavobacterium sp.]|uniref:type 4b pilus protein PilO2 n=1 Tax=Flavobacterium sp. TaxID=239 RepID=UPI00260D7557|nr:type 4b pilus protein PilO2 [Flavobacterium sp.]